ncbi:hypothetical protein ABZ622_22345 [Streptomyces sp. NPDC007164]|uniref:hypothetical protein n=1 Tax=Streptomyces sp. NPDC007164 TaxID=3156918 RepID=UPI0033DA5988
MRAQHERTAQALKMTRTDGEPFSGWDGRALGREDTPQPDSRYGYGRHPPRRTRPTANQGKARIPPSRRPATLGGHRPALLAGHDTQADGTACRTELSEHPNQPVVSTNPVLRLQPQLPDSRWPSLDGAPEKVAATTTDRVALCQEYVERATPAFLGIPAPAVTQRTTVHGDLYGTSLTAPELRLLDWEARGQGPLGHDRATLYAYSLLRPDAADRIPFASTVSWSTHLSSSR